VFAHHLYGQVVHSPVALPAPAADASVPPDITIATAETPLAHPHAAGDALAYQRLADGRVFVSWYGLLEFVVSRDGRNITAHARADTSYEPLYAHLLSHALAIALQQRGIESLHAVAFAIDGAAIALIGDCGYGKSTLAAHAVRAGARLLTDDLLVCEGGQVLPGAARVKLEPEVARRAFGERAGTPMYDERGKWIYPLGAAEFMPSPVRLARIYALRPDSAAPRIEALDGASALKALLSATFNPLEKSAARLASHMRYHAALARQVPILRLHVPRRFDRIDQVLAVM
jgi:hypothetical protein